jgi:hypothetical protein
VLNVTRHVHFANKVFNVRPMVRLVAKLVGSGPNRLKIVKLSHELDADLTQP